jgi:hypothetical protein
MLSWRSMPYNADPPSQRWLKIDVTGSTRSVLFLFYCSFLFYFFTSCILFWNVRMYSYARHATPGRRAWLLDADPSHSFWGFTIELWRCDQGTGQSRYMRGVGKGCTLSHLTVPRGMMVLSYTGRKTERERLHCFDALSHRQSIRSYGPRKTNRTCFILWFAGRALADSS